MKLYDYFRSSAAYRARIALMLKRLSYETIHIHLLKGEQKDAAYLAVNSQGLVPTLEHEGVVITQSMAIVEYLDDIAPEPKLVWGNAAQKARIRQLAQIIGCDTHPLNNLGPQAYLVNEFGADDAAKARWVSHWARSGLTVFESLLPADSDYCVSDAVSMADLMLIPQLYSMRRMKVPLGDFPRCRRIEAHCVRLPAFIAASPEMQKDAPADLEPIHGPHFKGDII